MNMSDVRNALRKIRARCKDADYHVFLDVPLFEEWIAANHISDPDILGLFFRDVMGDAEKMIVKLLNFEGHVTDFGWIPGVNENLNLQMFLMCVYAQKEIDLSHMGDLLWAIELFHQKD